MTSGRSDLIEIAGEVVHETEKAVLFFDGGRKVWLPKAAVEIDRDGRIATLTMPERLAQEKELI